MAARIRRRKKPPKPVSNLKVKARIVRQRRRIVTTGVLTWTFPTQRTDGSTINPADKLTAAFFDSFSPGPAIGTDTDFPGAAGKFVTAALAAGTHNFTTVITDSEGNSSAVSNTATLIVPSVLAPPEKVTNLAVTAGA